MKGLPPKPDFFKPLLPGFKNGLKIPKYFSKYILRAPENFSDEALLKRKGKEWRVSVRNGYFVGRRWARFAEENNLESGDFIVFKHHGNMVFDVNEIYDGITQCGGKHRTNGDRRTSEKPRFVAAETSKPVDEEIPSDHDRRPHFVSTISHSNIVWRYFTVPRAFAESNGLTGRKGEIIVKDEQERSWYFVMGYAADGQIRIRSSNLAEFIAANGFKKGDSYKFDVVAAGNGEETPMVRILSHDQSIWSYYVSRIKRYSLGRQQRLDIPKKFAESNGLLGKQRMILENKSGRTWEVKLSLFDFRLSIGAGWKKFVDENGIKAGDSFKFEIVENGAVPVVRFIVTDGARIEEEISSDDGEEEEEEEADDNSTDRPHFIARITDSNTDYCFLYVPKAFARSNGLMTMGQKSEIIVKDEQERSWHFDLSTSEEGDTRIRRGSTMAEFFAANGFKKGDSFKLEVVVAGAVPVVRILPDQSNDDPYYVFTSTMKASSFGRTARFVIPIKFARTNELCEKQRMIMENKRGRTWEVALNLWKDRFGISGAGWKKFTDDNGIKEGDAFRFEIVENGAVPVVRFIVTECLN